MGSREGLGSAGICMAGAEWNEDLPAPRPGASRHIHSLSLRREQATGEVKRRGLRAGQGCCLIMCLRFCP